MDKVLEDVLDSMQSENTETSTNENQDNQDSYEGSELDLDFSDFNEETDESEAETEEETDDANDEGSSSDLINNFATSSEKNAFASMRVQNKELQSTINELDEIAKNVGLSGYKEFLEKAKENSIAKQAKSEGISVELAKKLNDMEGRLEAINKREEAAATEAKQAKLAGTLDNFIKSNNLNSSIINKLSDDLGKDGFTVEQLMDMPESALNKLFSAYTNVNIQKTLDKKSSITQEMPVSQASKVDGDTINKQLDDLVKEIMGRN
jgi:hypothetical protein